jgi:predicted CxxxxCH...CXXCH cytochrome family protein
MRCLGPVVAAVALAACGEARTVESGTPWCPTWKDDVGTTITSRCGDCHSGDTPAGGVDLSTYTAAVSAPNRQAIATVLDPATADATHAAFSDLHPLVSGWAGQCSFAFVRSSIHPAGILDPASDDFHGKELARIGYRLDTCAGCHGADFKGGAAGADCTTCHTDPGGPSSCTTCHGAPPMSGAHVAHVTSPTLGRRQDCAQCHQVPEVYTAAGHVITATGEVDGPPAEVIFGALAQATVAAADRKGPPTFDPASATCSNVHCHGDTLGDDSLARTPRPMWNGGPTQAECGSCHGAPPGNHPPGAQCGSCHVGDLAAAHVNGVVDLGDTALGCNGCHGSPERPLTGAHRAHVELTRIANPVDCAACHVVPATLHAAGHIDSALPAEVTFGEQARAEQAAPAFTPEGRSCSGTYCHGGGARLAGDTAPTKLAAVSWTSTGGQATCGTCHGIPPVDPFHSRTPLTLSDCATCHAGTVDGSGNIRFVDGVTLHINGRPDAVAP